MKRYIKPETEVITLSLETSILAALSATAGGESIEDGGGTGDGNITTADAKRNDFDWDDWDD